jgi:hypothetical protein
MYRTLIAALFLACALAHGADAQPQAPFPIWDGHESIEQYAKRTNLPPTKTLDLGNGVDLDLVLIPAGKFVMGTPEPKPAPSALAANGLSQWAPAVRVRDVKKP